MPNIMQLLAQRQRTQQKVDEQRVTSAIIISGSFGRYSVNDGAHSLEAECTLTQQLKPGDRVWLARGRGINVIFAAHAKDKDVP